MYGNNKERYLAEIDSLRKMETSRNIFESISKFEELYDKDACDFNPNEIANMYKTMNHKAVTTLRNINSVLLQYTQWCQGELLVKDGINHYENFYGEKLYSYINKEYLENAFTSNDVIVDMAEEMLNPIDAFALIALYEGFGGLLKKDFFYAKMSDIKGNKLHLENRTMEVSDDFIRFAEAASRQTVYVSRSNSKYDKQLDDSSDLIYKPLLKSAEAASTKDRVIVARLKKELEALGYTGFNTRDLIRFGRVNYIRNKSVQNGVSPREYCFRNSKEIAEQFDMEESYIPVMYQDIKQFLE